MSVTALPVMPVTLPDHTQLPELDGILVHNMQEHPQSMLVTDALQPVLQRRHPTGRFLVGQDTAIYWRLTDPPERGAIGPDWFYVPDVMPLLDGKIRRSYVLWQEIVPPTIVLEFVSGDGSEERDTTPWEGKFWIYEHVIRPAYYGIYEVNPGRIELYQYVRTQFELVKPNKRGHLPIPELGVELGIWNGFYLNATLPWMRWFDKRGRLLPTGHELVDEQRQRGDRLAAKLRELGVDPDTV
jgi:Uma2 family endonuclease